MKKIEKAMLCHHLQIHLCVENLKILQKKSKDLELRAYLHRIVNEVKDISTESCDFLKNQLHQSADELSIAQKATLEVERLKTRMIDNDFTLCLEVKKVFNMILIKSMKYIFKHKKLNSEYLVLVDKQVNLCLSLESEISHFANQTFLSF